MPADLNDYFKKKNPNFGKRDEDNNENKRSGFEPPKVFKDFGGKIGILYVALILIAIIVIAKPFVIIHSGEVGIKSTAGKFDPNSLQPGLHFFIPFIQQIIIVDTKVRLINYTSNEDAGEILKQNSGIIRKNSISVLDARNLPVSIDITVQYNLNPQNAPQTIATWGLSWESKIIDPVVRDVVRSVAGRYTAEELPVKRNEIASQIDMGIREAIEKQSNKPVELGTIQLREIILPAKVKEQIERVQIAKQEAERTKYEVERANQEALKKAALAEGTAKAVIIEAKGKADAIKIDADAQAYANRQISQSLTDNLLKLRQIEIQGKFNDALRENKDTKLFLTPGGSVPNIWIDSKDKQQSTSINR